LNKGSKEEKSVVVFLTKSGGIIMGPITYLFGLIMNGIYEFFYLFGIQNIALTIVVFTIITRLLLLPLTIKQQKFTKVSSRMNPELQKIQAKYKGKKDEESMRRQQGETQALYDKYGTKPTAGCLPMIIQLPIMYALYRVINNVPAYVTEVHAVYAKVAYGIQNISGFEKVMAGLAKQVMVKGTDFKTVNHIIDVLFKFGSEQWQSLQHQLPGVSNVVADNIGTINRVNGFLGLDISHRPGWGFPGILIPIVSMLLQYIQVKQMSFTNKDSKKDSNKDNPAESAMKSMNIMMPLMSGFFCVSLPIGIGLYWIAGSAVTIVQQFFVNKYLDKLDIDELIQKSVEKASKRKPAMNMPTSSMSLRELAKKQTKFIDTTVSDQGEGSGEVKIPANQGSMPSKASQTNGSISDIANILKNRNGEKGDK
jgi:YidC/Oxa1 family membrane protein insertase